jgi:seryl-tRNA(Sec) selenium transferase
MINRRNALKALASVPLGSMAMEDVAHAAGPSARNIPEGWVTATLRDQLKPGPEIFQSIGVEPIINCRGTFTIIGGSAHRPEVGLAMEAASRYFVQLDELAMAVGERLAELTGAEWGMVSAGCAAGMKHVTAACVSGGNPEKLLRIPDLTGLDKTEVVLPRSRNSYDAAIKNIGVRMISVNTFEEFQNALNPRTAMIYLMADQGTSSSPVSLEAIAPVAKAKNIPILVDAAAQDLTIPNVHLRRGATVVAYSGGKVICGPQCAGLLLGDKNLLMSAWQASSPHHGPGRDNKVGREETLGMLAAVEAWVLRDHAAEWRTFVSWLELIAARLNTIDGVTTEINEPTNLDNHSPTLRVSWDPARFHITGAEVAEEVGRNKPRIALSGGGGRGGGNSGMTSITLTAFQMQPGNAQIVADRLHGVLSQTRAPKSTAMAPPAANLRGRWNATIQFFNSQSEHLFFIDEQDGNWLQGTHRGDFSTRAMRGTIEGHEVKLQSNYIFSGTLSGDTMAGDVHMGEYLTAKFTATRHDYPDARVPVVVPKGPPLAT